MRQRFHCTDCGLEIEGRQRPSDGAVVAYDQAGWDGTPSKPMRCATCGPEPEKLIYPEDVAAALRNGEIGSHTGTERMVK